MIDYRRLREALERQMREVEFSIFALDDALAIDARITLHNREALSIEDDQSTREVGAMQIPWLQKGRIGRVSDKLLEDMRRTEAIRKKIHDARKNMQKSESDLAVMEQEKKRILSRILQIIKGQLRLCESGEATGAAVYSEHIRGYQIEKQQLFAKSRELSFSIEEIERKITILEENLLAWEEQVRKQLQRAAGEKAA